MGCVNVANMEEKFTNEDILVFLNEWCICYLKCGHSTSLAYFYEVDFSAIYATYTVAGRDLGLKGTCTLASKTRLGKKRLLKNQFGNFLQRCSLQTTSI